MDKIKLIQETMPEGAEILIRTHFGNEWFIHYTMRNKPFSVDFDSVYKEYTEDLDSALDKVIEIIKSA